MNVFITSGVNLEADGNISVLMLKRNVFLLFNEIMAKILKKIFHQMVTSTEKEKSRKGMYK